MLHDITRCYIVLQGITVLHRVIQCMLHVVTGYYTVLHGVT